eukprot:2166877-Rhodomonas_salina.1
MQEGCVAGIAPYVGRLTREQLDVKDGCLWGDFGECGDDARGVRDVHDTGSCRLRERGCRRECEGVVLGRGPEPGDLPRAVLQFHVGVPDDLPLLTVAADEVQSYLAFEHEDTLWRACSRDLECRLL